MTDRRRFLARLAAGCTTGGLAGCLGATARDFNETRQHLQNVTTNPVSRNSSATEGFELPPGIQWQFQSHAANDLIVHGHRAVGPGPTDDTYVLNIQAAELPEPFSALYGIDARTGERRWTRLFPLALGTLDRAGDAIVAARAPYMVNAGDRHDEAHWDRVAERMPELLTIDSTTGATRQRWQSEDRYLVAGADRNTVVAKTHWHPDTKRVAAFDVASGAERWRKPVTSPVHASVHDDIVLVAETDTNDLRALDIASGQERWWYHLPSHPNDLRAASAHGRLAVAVEGALHAVDLATGDRLWDVIRDGWHPETVIATSTGVTTLGQTGPHPVQHWLDGYGLDGDHRWRRGHQGDSNEDLAAIEGFLVSLERNERHTEHVTVWSQISGDRVWRHSYEDTTLQTLVTTDRQIIVSTDDDHVRAYGGDGNVGEMVQTTDRRQQAPTPLEYEAVTFRHTEQLHPEGIFRPAPGLIIRSADFLVTSQDEAEQIQYSALPSDVRRFVNATDYDREYLAVVQQTRRGLKVTGIRQHGERLYVDTATTNARNDTDSLSWTAIVRVRRNNSIPRPAVIGG